MPYQLNAYRQRPLDFDRGYKPLDFFGHGLTGSVTADARLLSVNRHHPEHGYITLTAAPPFDESMRYNSDVVRTYRAQLVTQEGFGLVASDMPHQREAFLLEDVIPYFRFSWENGLIADVYTFAPPDYPDYIVQFWSCSRPLDFFSLNLECSLQRCAYTQLTEGGPLSSLSSQTILKQRDAHTIDLQNSVLQAIVTLYGVGISWQPSLTNDALSCSTNETFALIWHFPPLNDVPREAPVCTIDELWAQLNLTLASWRNFWERCMLPDVPTLELPMRRAVTYAHLCAVPVDEEATCILTDHQLLPLSWNRDAYYIVRALLSVDEEAIDLLRSHLLWMFEIAKRPNGYWERAYLASGIGKDPAFQLDQQLYPLLELVDYIDETGDVSLLSRFSAQITSILDLIFAREHHGLFPTEETPADDPISMPYHLSSHILLWYTFRRFARYCHDERLLPATRRAYERIYKDFVVTQAGQSLFAYLIDGVGGYQLYQDANDLPLALAPYWEFCSPQDTIWLNTMSFSFSEANIGGFYHGIYSGLGSIHTPAPWPLGDVQEYLFSSLTGDTARRDDIIRRLAHAAQWDGALPEAYNATTGEVVSRHWFAWPNSALLMALTFTH